MTPPQPPVEPSPVDPSVVEPDEQGQERPPVGPDIDFTDPNSRLAPYYLQASHVVAAIFLVALFLFFNLMAPLWHSDIWGHLRVGEWISENSRLPQGELFSPFSDQSQPAANFQWLAQVLLFQTYEGGARLVGGDSLERTAGGVDLLRALHAFLEAAKAAFLIAAFRRFTGSLPLALAGVLVVFVFSLAPSFIFRPQVFAEVLFAWILWLLAWPLDGAAEAGPLTWRRVAAVVLVMVLWANLHGSFPLGLALIGALWMGRTLDAWQRGGLAACKDRDLHRPLVALAASIVLLSLLNPHGIRVIPDVLEFAKNANVRTMQEWRPLDFSAGSGGHWGYLALLVLIAGSQLFSDRVLTPSFLVLLLLFGFVPLLQERLMTWWVMIAPLLLIFLWKEIGRPFNAWFEQKRSVLSLRKTILAAAVVVVGLVWSSPVQLLLGHAPVPIDVSVSRATLWPVTENLLEGRADSAADTHLLEKSALYQGLRKGLASYAGGRFRGRMLTAEALGDFLIWSLPPKAPVLVYSHVHVFPEDFWEEYMEVLFARPGWRYVLDRHDVNLVVAQADSRQDLLVKLRDDPEWEIILDDTDRPINPQYRLFAALRKNPLPLANETPRKPNRETRPTP